MKYFTIIIWNTAFHLKDRILKDVPNFIDGIALKIKEGALADFVNDVYKLDKRCAHDIVLPPKIKRLSECDNNVLILARFAISEPTFDRRGVCAQAVELKEGLRTKYKSEVKNYIRDIVVHIADNHEHAEYVWDKYGSKEVDEQKLETHRERYDYFLNLLNKGGVDFVIMRGFKYLPNKADTDLDTVIHPDSNEMLGLICKQLLDRDLVRVGSTGQYVHPSNDNLLYLPIFTKGTEGQHLPGGYYRFDTYSDLFFYENGEGGGKNAVMPSSIFKKYLFDNKIKIDNYYIPNPHSEIILLIYRRLYDKRGNWSQKHKDRIKELMSAEDFDENEFKRVCSFEFSDEQNVCQHLKNERYDLITKPNQKLNLFLIRRAGMKKNITDNILSKIKQEGYKIIDLFHIHVNNNAKFYKNFYKNFNNFEKEILKENSNQCLVVVTDLPEGKDPQEFKNEIRKQYVEVFPNKGGVPGNLIHASDSPEACTKELRMLLDKNKTDFKNIGTYYEQRDV